MSFKLCSVPLQRPSNHPCCISALGSSSTVVRASSTGYSAHLCLAPSNIECSLHSILSHLSVRATQHLISECFVWPGMTRTSEYGRTLAYPVNGVRYNATPSPHFLHLQPQMLDLTKSTSTLRDYHRLLMATHIC